ncbi:MAG: energy-coupled thiamine transporter ThiT [Clostridiales bacterium]|nr:energy-coupled thiamine transporter ThiT [Clostridiales bacterium]
MKTRTQKLTISAIMIALGTVLSLVRLFEMPYGGSITPFSMVPLMLCAYLFGTKWGLFCGVIFGLLQGLTGALVSGAFIGQSVYRVFLILFLDYIAAFMVLGFAGIFVKKTKKTIVSFSLGCIFSSFLRFLVHLFSGIFIWGSYAQSVLEGFNDKISLAVLNNFSGMGLAAVYSLIYNASFMLPETLISLLAVAALSGLAPLHLADPTNADKV